MEFRVAYPNELYHHGVKGQRWGVRRYQRPDGTLTKAGEKRYHKRLVEKAVIIGGQARFANANAGTAERKYRRAERKAALKPTDKALRKEKERRRVYEALQKEAESWNKLTEKSIKEAQANANAVRKKYAGIELSRIPENTTKAGKMYFKRMEKHALPGFILLGAVGGGVTSAIGANRDRQVAEYFREHPRG